MKISDKGLNYDNIVLIPRIVNEIESRDLVKTNIYFCGVDLKFHILAAPMPDVCDANMAIELGKLGGLGIIHRFQTKEEQAREYRKCSNSNINAVCAIGVNDDWYERLSLVCNEGCNIICIDVANGACRKVAEVVKKIRNSPFRLVYIIAGNVASRQGYKFLADLGVDGVRCGIAGGSVCSTKIETGVYSPMFSMLEEIRECKENYAYKTSIIADGNIKIPAHANKALVFADICMAGGIFAGTEQSPGNVIKQPDGSMVKLFRGAASFSTQKYEAGKKPTYIEGMETFVPYTGQLSKIVERYIRGLRSCMTYFNAMNLEDFRKNISYQQL